LSILLDTNICVAAINGRPAETRSRLNRAILREGPAAVSAITVFELWYGIAKSMQVARNLERTNLFLESQRILAFDEDDARIAGQVRHEFERRGTPIGPYDYLIAAHALRHDLLLVTANVREFSRVQGLRWEDWTGPA
jgi:tRNA(fMet)-specific endonuclease VapC